MKCNNCLHENPLAAKFCSNCGLPLRDSSGQISPKESPPRQPENHPSLQQHIQPSGQETASGSLTGERKYITALCSDLSGYTAMCEKLDPEEVKGIMKQIFGDIARVVAGYDAFIEKFIGDAVMALFGVPKTHEDDPVRALEAARKIHQLVTAYSSRLQDQIGHELSMKTGVYTGLAVIGEIDLHRGTHGIAGEPLNRASRLCGLAGPGEILVGYGTYYRAKGGFSFKDLGGFKVKGIAKPVQVYKVVSVKSQSEIMESVGDLADGFVGREPELVQMRGMFNRLHGQQEGGVIFITGNAGVGKSRLLAEAKKRFSMAETRWLQGRSLSYGQLISYWPFMEIIRRFAGITEDDNELAAWNKLLHHVYDLFHDETPEVLPYLASLMTLAVPGEYKQRVEFLNGKAMGRQIMRAMWRFFERLVQRQPLILVFEDLHWTDRSSLELLEHLSSLVKDHPLLICLLSRPEIEGPQIQLRHHFATEYAHQYHEMMLSPLTPSESVGLMGFLLQCDKMPRQVRELIYEKAAGNPLFIEEVVQSLKEMGVVVQEGKACRWDFLPQFDEFMISGTIRGLITARIDRLHDEVRRVLKIAAVIGRNFFYRVLQAIDEADPSLDASLERLQQIDLIREKRQIPELEYMFKHDLTQEAAYESILIQKRIELHRKVGEIIEVLFRDRLEEFYGLLSYHYSKAEEWEKAQHYLFKAADQAGKIAADSEALDHYKKALAAYERVYGDRWEPLQRAVLERKIGEALYRRGNHEQAMDYFCSALRYLGYPLPESCWSIRGSVIKHLGIQTLHRLLPSIFVRRQSLPIDDKLKEVYQLYELMGWIDFFMNRERLLLYGLSGLNRAEIKGHTEGMLRGYVGLGLVCDCLGLFHWAGRYHQRAYGLMGQIQSPLFEGFCYLGLGLHEDTLGNWDQAIKYYQQSRDKYWQVGNMIKWGEPMMQIANLYHKKGEFNKSFEFTKQVVQMGEESGDIQLCGWGSHGQGLNLLYLGLLDGAAICLQKAIDLLWDIPDYLVVGLAKKDLGRCYLRRGKIDAGTALIEEGCQILTEYCVNNYFDADFYNSLAEARLRKAEAAGTAGNADALKTAKSALKLSQKYSKRFKGGLPVALRLEGIYAFLEGNVSKAQKYWQRSLDAAEKMGARYELGATYLEFGKRCGKRNYLEQARDIFRETGASFDLEIVEGLLQE